MRIYVKARRLKWLILVIVTTGAVLPIVVLYGCSSSSSLKEIHDVCEMYRQGEMAGNLCHKLCSEDKFQFNHCGGFFRGKKVAFMRCLDCEPEMVVLKNELDTQQYMQYIPTSFQTIENAERLIIDVIGTIVSKFNVMFSTNLPKLSKQKDILSYFWRQNFSDYTYTENRTKSNNLIRIALQSVLALSKQKEYASMLILKDTPYVPKLHGTCGPSYIVEYTPSLMHLGYANFEPPNFLSLMRVSWQERVRVALQLLELLQYLETMEPPVFMCDLYPRNFGLDHQGNVVMLDTDCLMYGPLVPTHRACKSDEDCRYLSCKGKCDVAMKRCMKGPINTQLEVACTNVFVSSVSVLGLLRFPPSHVTTELQSLLTECIHPSNRSVTSPWKSDTVIRQKLIEVLHRSLT